MNGKGCLLTESCNRKLFRVDINTSATFGLSNVLLVEHYEFNPGWENKASSWILNDPWSFETTPQIFSTLLGAKVAGDSGAWVIENEDLFSRIMCTNFAILRDVLVHRFNPNTGKGK